MTMTMTKRAALCAVLVGAFMLVVVAVAIGADISFPRVSGDVGFRVRGANASATFSAHATGPVILGEEHQPAVGRFEYRSGDVWYVAKVEHIHAHSATEAHFGGGIVDASDPGLIGQFAHVVIIDGGHAAGAGDEIGVTVTASDVHVQPKTVKVTSGDLVVRTQ